MVQVEGVLILKKLLEGLRNKVLIKFILLGEMELIKEYWDFMRRLRDRNLILRYVGYLKALIMIYPSSILRLDSKLALM